MILEVIVGELIGEEFVIFQFHYNFVSELNVNVY